MTDGIDWAGMPARMLRLRRTALILEADLAAARENAHADGVAWLDAQGYRIAAQMEHADRVRTAPDEVVHRRVDGQTVISRRMLHRRTTNLPVQVDAEDEVERARRYT